MYKGSPKLGLDELSVGYKMAIICPVVALITGLSIFVAIPYLKRRADKMGVDAKLMDESSDQGLEEQVKFEDELTTKERIMNFLNR
jgi:hypothetical protein